MTKTGDYYIEMKDKVEVEKVTFRWLLKQCDWNINYSDVNFREVSYDKSEVEMIIRTVLIDKRVNVLNRSS